MRQTSLDKYRAALDGTGYMVATGPTRYGNSLAVTVLDSDKVMDFYNEAEAEGRGNYRGDRVGFMVEFDNAGRFIAGYDLKIHGARYYKSDGSAETHLVYGITKGTGRRGSPLYTTLREIINKATRTSPVGRAQDAIRAAEQKAQRDAEAEAKVERIKAIKPDVRNAVWSIQSEMERAQNSYASTLKTVISRAEELLRRAEENPTYVYDSELTNLARIVADAVLAGGKVQGFATVMRSELAPLFEGSPWSD